MGNVPTWRDVAAPDFNTALGAYGIAGRNITQAGEALTKGLGDFQTDAQNTAAAQLAAAASKYTDQKSLEAALTNGSLAGSVSNPGYLTADAYKIPDARASTLLTQATGQQALDHSTKMAPLLETGQDLSNKNVATNTATTALDNEYKSKTLADRIAYQHGALDTQTEDLKEKKQTFADSQAKTAVDVNGTKWAVNAAQGTNDPNQAIANLQAAKTKEDADAKAQGRESELDPNTYADAMAKVQRQLALNTPNSGAAPNLPNAATQDIARAANGAPGSAPSGPNSAAGAAFLSSIPNAETRDYVSKVYAPGGDNSPDAVWQRMVGKESGGKQFDKNGNPLRSDKGATGAAQVMEGTGPEAAKYAGVAWDKNKWENDRDYNLKIGRAYFDHLTQLYNGDTRLAAAAYNGGPGNVDKWNLAQEHNDVSAQAYHLTTGAQQANDQILANGVNSTFKDTQADTKSNPGVLTAGLLQDPRFKDADPTAVANQISEIVNDSKTKGGAATITPATAASLLSRFGGRQHWYEGLTSPLTRKIAIEDQDGLDQALKDIRTGNTQLTLAQTTGTAVASQQVDTARATAEDLFSQYTHLQNLADTTRPDLKSAADAALAKYKAAKVGLQGLIAAHPMGEATRTAKDKDNPAWTPDGPMDVKHDPSAAALAKAAARAKQSQNAPAVPATPATSASNAAAALNSAAAPSAKKQPFDLGYAAANMIGGMPRTIYNANLAVSNGLATGLQKLHEAVQDTPENEIAKAKSLPEGSKLRQAIIAAQLQRIAERDQQTR